MRVLLVVTGLPSRSEPARSVFNMVYAEALAARNIDVTILYLRGVSRKRRMVKRSFINGISLIEVSIITPQKFFRNKYFLAPLILKSFLLDRKSRNEIASVDIIHAISGGSLELAHQLSKQFGKKFVGQFIGTDVNIHLAKSAKRKLFMDAVNSSSFLSFESNALLNSFECQVRTEVRKSVIYRGIRIEDFGFSIPKTNQVVILFLGGFRNDDANLKGGLTLLKALEQIDNLDMDVLIKIGGPNSKKYSSTIKGRLAKNIQLSFIGAIEKEGVRKELQDANLVVIPSLFEGLPNLLFEAMSSGNLVIASRVGGIPEVIKDGVNGVLVDPGDELKLRDAITQNLDMEKIKQLALNARTTVDDYHYDKYINNYLQLYMEVIDKLDFSNLKKERRN